MTPASAYTPATSTSLSACRESGAEILDAYIYEKILTAILHKSAQNILCIVYN